jgi:hypothetical protein
MVASAAMANVPDPTNSTCPSWIFVVGTLAGAPDNVGGRATITVRDFANNPISGSVVEISFRNACDINLCNGPGVISGADLAEFSTAIQCDSSIVRGITNAAGQFSFTIVGSGKPGNEIDTDLAGNGRVGSIIITASDRKICSVSAVTLDQNSAGNAAVPPGDTGVNGGDFAFLANVIGQIAGGGAYVARGDYNCSSSVNGADLSFLAPHVGRYALGSGGFCPGGQANLCKTAKCPAPF